MKKKLGNMTFVNPVPHPIYDHRWIRAIFDPVEPGEANDGIKQMIGHEFVWKFVGFLGKEPLWMPADPEDIDSYFEVVDTKCPEWKALWIMERDLDIIRVEKLDA